MNFSNIVELTISLLLDIWLLAFLARRRVHRTFPLFFAFTVMESLALAARLAVVPSYRMYFYVYWSTEAVLLALSLAALHEVFHWMFEGFYRLWWFRFIYYGGIAAALAVAVRSAFVSPPVQAHPVISLILDIGIAINFVRMGIVSLFAFFDKLLQIEFRRFAHGIVIGFGISSAGSLIGYLAFSGFGTKVDSFARNTSAVAYIVGLVAWIAAFYRPEPDEKEWSPPMSPEQMLEEVQGYMRGLGIGRTKR